MVKAIIVNETGGPEVLSYEDISIPTPKKGEVRVVHKAIGLNYIDVYFRSGVYPFPRLPGIPGMEGSGVVKEIGEGVEDISIGDRVAYAAAPPGSYLEERNIKSEQLVKLPDEISFELGAAMMLQGMTVEYLVRRTYEVKSGETVLVHAAAGGVGLMLCQWLKHIGARVIGTVSSEEKVALASNNGCDHPINYKTDDWVSQVKDLTNGKGVPVVYDSVAKDTFKGSLECLSIRGLMINYGQASGAYNEFEIGMLAPKSLFLTRPGLFQYIINRNELIDSSNALFDVVKSGAVKIQVNQKYALSDAQRAHQDLESRKTTGSTILIP